MITSREDYEFYLEADRLALGRKRKRPKIIGDEIWVFQCLLRKLEYYNNCKRSFLWKPYYYFLRHKFHLMSILLGFTIPLNVFGPGLSIGHRGTIVVNENAKLGANCRIHVDVNIGTKAGYSNLAPSIGDNVYIGPGAKIFGSINIADGIAIGSNSVVNKSFDEKGITIAGIPAKKISNKGSEGLLIKATEILTDKKFEKSKKSIK
jgi:serine O-acetyltransferase